MQVVFLLLLGLVALIGGAELLVRGAARLAAAIGIPPLLIGLTVVAFGTGAPEIVTAVQANLAGEPNLALGNVIGSNISNILLILGISAVIVPLLVSQRLVILETPLMIGVSILVFLLGMDGVIARWEGLLLLVGGIAYTAFVVRQSRQESQVIRDEYAQEFGQKTTGGQPASFNSRQRILELVFVLVGLALLILGASAVVDSAVEFARILGVSELVIGLTIVSVGTSLPELVTSALASWRGERDIAVGNILGSNLFNLLIVLGLAAGIAPGGLSVSPAVLNFDLPVMIAVAIACLPILFRGHRIDRWEGALFLVYYLAYTAYLLLDAAQHDALPVFSAVMLEFIIPLTVLTLAILVVRELRRIRRGVITQAD